tara:strand:+ start:31 stop:933 length:903 start_codon:yes stop_codon:yes gene_type:complete
MATLTGKSVASTYTSLLKLEGNAGSTVAGASGDAVQVKTGDNDATALYLNTDRVGIGTATPATTLEVTGEVSTTKGDSGTYPYKIGYSSNAASRSWFLDSDRTAYGDFALETEATKDGVRATRLYISPAGNVTVSTGNLVIGTAGKGIDFSNQASPAAGMNAELLDHYEEGSWTPVVAEYATPANDMSTSSALGSYVRIGNMVTVQAFVNIDGNGDATNAAMGIHGLPFTSENVGTRPGLAIGEQYNLNLASGGSLAGWVLENNTKMYLLEATNTNYSSLLRDEISTDAFFSFTVTYKVA